MARRRKKGSGRGCGCSTKSGKLYIVKTPGRLKATKCKSKAERLVRNCRKRNKRAGACTWVPTSGARRLDRRRRRSRKRR